MSVDMGLMSFPLDYSVRQKVPRKVFAIFWAIAGNFDVKLHSPIYTFITCL